MLLFVLLDCGQFKLVDLVVLLLQLIFQGDDLGIEPLNLAQLFGVVALFVFQLLH